VSKREKKAEGGEKKKEGDFFLALLFPVRMRFHHGLARAFREGGKREKREGKGKGNDLLTHCGLKHECSSAKGKKRGGKGGKGKRKSYIFIVSLPS